MADKNTVYRQAFLLEIADELQELLKDNEIDKLEENDVFELSLAEVDGGTMTKLSQIDVGLAKEVVNFLLDRVKRELGTLGVTGV